MRLSKDFFYTLREDAKDEDSVSGNLLVKAGFIKKVSNGIYMNMPLGEKVTKNIINIVREEMNRAGANELSMPHMLPMEYFERSGRASGFGPSMFKFSDRYGKPYALGPTHEEFFVYAAQSKVKSYKDLPFNLYQIGDKYRDEPRPRLGLIRVREFIMKDAYSFDANEDSMKESYQKMFDAYHRIFTRLGLNYKVVRADTGIMGGLLSEEFQAVTDTGEDILVLCDSCDYSSNIEVSKCVPTSNVEDEEERNYSEVYTPNSGTIEEVTSYLKLPVDKFVKTMIYNIDSVLYAVMVPADREVNEVKLQKLLNAESVELASEEDVTKVTNARVGFAGPVGLSIPIIMDVDIKSKKNFIVGANKSDYHLIDVNIKDFTATYIEDIKNIKEGDVCPKCGGKVYFKKGIEVGNTFMLGTKYSEKLGLNYLDKENKLNPVHMGCYGIGIGRNMAAVVDQSNDEKGIIWPMNIAPYKVAIVLIDKKNEAQVQAAEKLYANLTASGIDVILDDRDERAGVKFADMELIGIPIRVTVGKKVTDGLVELKMRTDSDNTDYKLDEAEDVIKDIIKRETK
ncbi:MAG: proline--tRNA ligase [Clostridia bacterium]|nr:proline--tRNA ligase [Clostridia bacterium]